MEQPLRFGIVGCGIVGKVHARAIEALADGELVAVADEASDRAETLAREFGVQPFASLADMLASADLDVVDVCTPSGMHGEHAVAVMESGRHVIVEKPMEITRPAMERMLHAQREAAVKLTVISQHRFDPATVRVRSLVEEGAFGRLVMGNAHVLWWRSQEYYDSGAWRGTWALDGGGVLMNQSIHSIDLLCWLMGPVVSVRAYTDTRAHTMETEDVAVAALRFESGALGTIAATTGAYPGVATRIEVFGDLGSAIIENDGLAYLHLARDETQRAGAYGAASGPLQREIADTAAGDPAAVAAGTHGLQIADAIRAIREDGTPLVDGEQGRHPVEVILAIYQSARSGDEVRLSTEALGHS